MKHDDKYQPVFEIHFVHIHESTRFDITVEPLILATLYFGVWVNVIIILDPVILTFLLPTILKRYCIQIFAARYFRELARLAKLRAREKTAFTVSLESHFPAYTTDQVCII